MSLPTGIGSLFLRSFPNGLCSLVIIVTIHHKGSEDSFCLHPKDRSITQRMPTTPNSPGWCKGGPHPCEGQQVYNWLFYHIWLTALISQQWKLGVQGQEVRVASASGLFYPKVLGSVQSFLLKHSSCGSVNTGVPHTQFLAWQVICLFEISHILSPVYLKSLAQGDEGRQNQRYRSLHSLDVFIEICMKDIL